MKDTIGLSPAGNAGKPTAKGRLRRALIRYKAYYFMLIPGLAYIAIFHYAPMFGLVVAFQDYKLFLGVSGSKFVGFDNFKTLFEAPQFITALRNTFIISAYKVVLGFPVPILLALLINEIRSLL